MANQCWRMLASRMFIHCLSKVFWDNHWSYPKNEKWSGGWAAIQKKWGHLASIKLDGRYHKTSKSHSIIATCCQSQYLSMVENPCVLGEIICCKSQHPASHHPHGQTVFLVAAIFLMPTKSGMTSNYWTIYHGYGSKLGYQWKHKTDFRSIHPSIWGGANSLKPNFCTRSMIRKRQLVPGIVVLVGSIPHIQWVIVKWAVSSVNHPLDTSYNTWLNKKDSQLMDYDHPLSSSPKILGVKKTHDISQLQAMLCLDD